MSPRVFGFLLIAAAVLLNLFGVWRPGGVGTVFAVVTGLVFIILGRREA